MRIEVNHLPSESSILGDARTGVIFSFADRLYGQNFFEGVHSDEQPFYMVAKLPKGVKKRKNDTFVVALDGKWYMMAGSDRVIEIHSNKRGFSFEYGEPSKKGLKLADIPVGQVFQYRGGRYFKFTRPNSSVIDVPAGKILILHAESGEVEIVDDDPAGFIYPSAKIVQTVSL